MKQMLNDLKVIKKICEQHYPLCENCPFGASNYYDCEVRDFVHQLDQLPKDWDRQMMERKLK